MGQKEKLIEKLKSQPKTFRNCAIINCAFDAGPDFLGKAEERGGLTPGERRQRSTGSSEQVKCA